MTMTDIYSSTLERLLYLDTLYTKVQTITGFTVEQLLDLFLQGYTLKAPAGTGGLT